MVITVLNWPTKEEYDAAVRDWKVTVLDSEIRSGTLAEDAMGIYRFGGANLYVTVYKIGDWLMRCFCSNPPNQTPPDILERYVAIDQFCHEHINRVSALLPISLIEKGIIVGQRILPVVKMPFLSSTPSLGEFIADHYDDNSTRMLQLSAAWLRMIRELEYAQVAHGDLDLTNVLVQQEQASLKLKLIDYDNVWLPQLTGRNQTEFGHAAFQHPVFLTAKSRPYNAEMDRFSALTIYISLRLLAQKPELYDEWNADESEQLLFSEEDYQHAGLATSRIAQARKLAPTDLVPFIEELNASLREARIPASLDDIRRRENSLSAKPASQNEMVQKPLFIQGLAVSDWNNKVYNGAAQGPEALELMPQQSINSTDLVSASPLREAPRRGNKRTFLIILCFMIIFALLVTIAVLLLAYFQVIHFAAHPGPLTTGIQTPFAADVTHARVLLEMGGGHVAVW